jgi:hypothetical protein
MDGLLVVGSRILLVWLVLAVGVGLTAAIRRMRINGRACTTEERDLNGCWGVKIEYRLLGVFIYIFERVQTISHSVGEVRRTMNSVQSFGVYGAEVATTKESPALSDPELVLTKMFPAMLVYKGILKDIEEMLISSACIT